MILKAKRCIANIKRFNYVDNYVDKEENSNVGR